MAFVRQIMEFIDDTIATAAQESFVAVAGGYGGVITMLATLALGFYGLGISMGMFKVRAGDFFQLVMRIVLIFTFGLTWANFSVIYDALTNTGDTLVTALFSAAGGSSTDAIQSAEKFASAAQDTSASVIRSEGSITRGVLGAIMYLLLAALQAIYILIAGFAKMMIGILIGLAPFAIGATMFNRTQFLFEAWLSSLIGYFMYPVAAAGVMGFISTVASKVFDGSDNASLIGVTGVVVIILVGIFALRSIPQAAANITGQMNLAAIAPEALNITSKPIQKAARMGGRSAGQFLSGATTGGQTMQRAAQDRRFGSATDLKIASAGASFANNSAGYFVQRRRDVQFAREANSRIRSRPT